MDYFDAIATNQGWDDATQVIILKGCLERLDPTGQAIADYAARCANEENEPV